ncbi:hypothetical protein GQX73_g5204 [Xylaria multiplex]|uniref:Uncharacterized protein n=1 Tax=Xylaria multiplex TaxID=323545 RepID=A0A7C8MR34_9PEZI|nr:hypothetical protein GQX73_g5204 [Xylaria multiplex]
MADTVRGDGLHIAHNALAALVEDPERLERMRARFSESPPSYRTHQSGSTLSRSPDAPSDDDGNRGWREIELFKEHAASRPSYQYEAQVKAECERIYKERHPTASIIRQWSPNLDIRGLATETIKKNWIEQGIWKDEWHNDHKPSGQWKHEEPLKSEPESETDSGVEGEPLHIFSQVRKKTTARRRKCEEDIRKIAERRPILEREREASQPYHQFLWQVSRERERIQSQPGAENSSALDLLDVNTRAYGNIKSKWVKWGLWHIKWGILPGMWWKHERPIAELLANDPIYNPVNEPEAHDHEARESPARRSPMEPFRQPSPQWPIRHGRGHASPVDPSPLHFAQNRLESFLTAQPPPQIAGVMGNNQPSFNSGLDLFGSFRNGEASNPPLPAQNNPGLFQAAQPPLQLVGANKPLFGIEALNESREFFGRYQPNQTLNAFNPQHSSQNRTGPFPTAQPPLQLIGANQPIFNNTGLNLFGSSRNGEAAGPQHPVPNRPEPSPISQSPLQSPGAMGNNQLGINTRSRLSKTPNDHQPQERVPARRRANNGAGQPSSPAPIAPRRSKRLQEAKINAAESIEIAVANSPKVKVAGRRKRAAASNSKAASSAKPKGVSKTARPTTTKRKTRRG